MESLPAVWALPLSLATTEGISYRFLFLRVLRCFSSPRSLLHKEDTSKLVGFPIRKSPADNACYGSPRLIAVIRVLHRFLVPRHPPYALRLLIMKNTVVAAMEFSRCARLERRDAGLPGASRPWPVSQNSTAWNAEVDVVLGELGIRTAETSSDIDGPNVLPE